MNKVDALKLRPGDVVQIAPCLPNCGTPHPYGRMFGTVTCSPTEIVDRHVSVGLHVALPDGNRHESHMTEVEIEHVGRAFFSPERRP